MELERNSLWDEMKNSRHSSMTFLRELCEIFGDDLILRNKIRTAD